MKLFLFRRIQQATEYYHPEGGLVIVADSIAHALELLRQDEHIQPTEAEWVKCIEYEIAGNPESVVYVFPDAGCCG